MAKKREEFIAPTTGTTNSPKVKHPSGDTIADSVTPKGEFDSKPIVPRPKDDEFVLELKTRLRDDDFVLEAKPAPRAPIKLRPKIDKGRKPGMPSDDDFTREEE